MRTDLAEAAGVGGRELAEPGAALGLRTAVRLHGCYSYRSADVVEVVVPRGGDHRNGVARVARELAVATRDMPT